MTFKYFCSTFIFADCFYIRLSIDLGSNCCRAMVRHLSATLLQKYTTTSKNHDTSNMDRVSMCCTTWYYFYSSEEIWESSRRCVRFIDVMSARFEQRPTNRLPNSSNCIIVSAAYVLYWCCLHTYIRSPLERRHSWRRRFQIR